jgi:hypothetical protein
MRRIKSARDGHRHAARRFTVCGGNGPAPGHQGSLTGIMPPAKITRRSGSACLIMQVIEAQRAWSWSLTITAYQP